MTNLRIVVGGSVRECTGYANFFVARGDSAAVPPDLLALGFPPDANRWYIERWEDDTSDGGMRAMPAQKETWGSIKVLYR